MRIGNERHLLDLQSHQEVLLELARENRNAACIFARCTQRGQPNFFQFASSLVELYSNDDGVVGALNSALIQTSGFGYEYDWHTSAIQTVQAVLDGPELSSAARGSSPGATALRAVPCASAPRDRAVRRAARSPASGARGSLCRSARS